MEVKTFLIQFEKSLIANGFPSDSARVHTLKIAKSLSDSDKIRIHNMQSADGVRRLAENYLSHVRSNVEQNKQSALDEDTKTIARQFTKSAQDDEDDDVKIKTKGSTKVMEKVPSADEVKDDASTIKVDSVATSKPEKVKLTERGRENYRNWMLSKGIGYAALGILIAVASFVVYALISVLIAALVALLIGVAVIGCIGFLAGLIYGIITLFSVTPEGIYEIGLSLIIIAVTLASSIGLYNLAIRIVPILWKRFTRLLKEKIAEYKEFLNDVRRECNEQ